MQFLMLSVQCIALLVPMSSRLGSIESKSRVPPLSNRLSRNNNLGRPSYRCSNEGKLPISISVGSSVWMVDTKQGIKNALTYLNQVLDKSSESKEYYDKESAIDIKQIGQYISELKQAERIQKECYPQSMEFENVESKDI